MYGVIRKISPYTNRKAWKLQVEIDDLNVPEHFKTNPWSIKEIPVEIEEVSLTEKEKERLHVP